MSHSNNEIMTPITRRERRLREELLQIDEDLSFDIDRLQKNAEYRRIRLTKQVNKVRDRQIRRLDRRDRSKIYRKFPILYYILLPILTIGRLCRSFYNWLTRKADKKAQITHHRSFYLTKRGNFVRKINIASPLRFIGQVSRFVWANRRIYLWPWLIISVIMYLVIGVNDNQNYLSIRDAIVEVDSLNYIQQVIAAVVTVITGALIAVGGANQFIIAVTLLLSWLALVYIARHVYSGNTKLTFRRAFYESAAPLVPILCIIFLILLQAVPLVLVSVGYVALSGAMYINQGISIENMSAVLALSAAVALTVYWMSASLLSLIVVTIPGIYPMRALYESTVLIAGRRAKVLGRLLVMIVIGLLAMIVVSMPLVMLDRWLKFNDYFPLIQLMMSFVVGGLVVWMSVYLYMLYRRLIDSPEMPIGNKPRRQWWSFVKFKKGKK